MNQDSTCTSFDLDGSDSQTDNSTDSSSAGIRMKTSYSILTSKFRVVLIPLYVSKIIIL